MLRQKLNSALRQLADHDRVRLELDDASDLSTLIHTAHDAGLDEAAVLHAAGESIGLEVAVDLVGRTPSAAFLENVPIGFARQHYNGVVRELNVRAAKHAAQDLPPTTDRRTKDVKTNKRRLSGPGIGSIADACCRYGL